MAYIKEYWDNKESRALLAQQHTELMDINYSSEIAYSVDKTKHVISSGKNETKYNKENAVSIQVVNLDSVQAIHTFGSEKTAVLNFASYKNPGGMFLNGSKAQEECLCHSSTLYNVLREFEPNYYFYNRQKLNRALYLDVALYSPNILFFNESGDIKKCDVITCAAPNKSTARRYCRVTNSENSTALRDRIKLVWDIANNIGQVDTLILGAYGCGVFGQDATEVATIFKEVISQGSLTVQNVIFAIPEGRDKNLEKFKEVFGVK